MPDRPRPDDVAYLTGLVREFDRPRYYATLFAPEPVRADLFALYGFAVEIARIPDQVRDPTLGRIRLQWWRDSLAGDVGQVGAGETPALRGIQSVIQRHALALAPFEALVDARDADLYSDPPATLAELESFFEVTEAVLFRTGASLLLWSGQGATETAHEAGLAYGVARRLSRFRAERARGRTILPLDLLRQEGLEAADAFAPEPAPGVYRGVLTLGAAGRRHLRAVQASGIPPEALAAFLPLAVVAPLLGEIEGRGSRGAPGDVPLSDFQTMMRILAARLRGRI